MKTNRTMEELLEYLEVRKKRIEEWNACNDLDKAEVITGTGLERSFVGQGAASLMDDIQGFLSGEKSLGDELVL